MIGFTVIQIVFAVGAVYYGGKVAMSFGRDLRKALFHQVTDFSTREVGAFGAPSLITRITNDVQQVQMLVVMACTMAIAAPITMVVGVVMALRQDVGLSAILLVSMPAAAIVLGIIVSRMVPAFRVMQERIDQINRVLREQITGIRVVRAFVREPEETQRFATANEELTDTSLRAGRLMSSMFPTVNLLINLSSVGVLWIGANRVADGDIQVGSLVAYLSYLVQILMSVVMATFMVSMIPRARCRPVASRRCSTPSRRSCRRPTPSPVVAHGALEFRDVGFHYPGAEHAGAHRHLVHDGGRADHGDRRQHRRGQDHARQPHPPAVRRHVGHGAGRRRRRARARPRLAVEQHRPRSAEAVPVLRHGGQQPAVRQARRHRGRDVGGAARSPRPPTSCAACRAGSRPGSSRAAPTCRAGSASGSPIARALIRKPEIYVFDDSFSALDLTTDARLRAALGPYTADAAVVIVAQRVSTISTADVILVLEDGELVGRGTHDELIATCPTYAEIVQSQIGEKERGMTVATTHGRGEQRRGDLPGCAGDPRRRTVELGGRADREVEGLQDRGAPARPAAQAGAADPLRGRRRGDHQRGAQRARSARARARHRHHLPRRDHPPGHRLRRAAPRAVPGRRPVRGVSALLSILTAYILAGVVQRLMFRLRSAAEDKLNALPLSYVDQQARGDLLSRVTNDIDNIAQSLQQTLSQMLTSILLLLGVAVMMFTISPLLAVVALTTVPVSVYAMRVIAGRARPRFIAQWKNTGALNAQVEETFTGHAIVKAFGRQHEVEERFRETNDELYEASFGAQFMSSLMQPATMFLGNVQYVLVAVVGGLRVASGAITVGDVQAFIQYSRTFSMPLTQLASMMNVFQSGIASLERVLEFLDAEEQSADDAADARTRRRCAVASSSAT